MVTAAPTFLKALKDATLRWPKRKRAGDGIIGDAAHQQRKSDHNEGNAFDLTHDPKNGVDCELLSRQVIWDERVKYVIWNRQICIRDELSYNRSGDESCTFPYFNGPETTMNWKAYKGPNPHTKHMHVSIRAEERDNLAPWPWSPDGPSISSDNRLSGPKATMSP